MAPRRIASVGFELASNQVDFIEFTSKQTLLDWDLILFDADAATMIRSYDSYQGKVCLNEDDSFRLREQCEHWRREIVSVLKAKRNVVCFLSPQKEIFIDTGKRTHTGNGRNRQTTRHVELFTSYRCIPAALSPRNSTGKGMRLQASDSILAPYWSSFANASEFKVQIDNEKLREKIITRAGDKAVGGLLRQTDGGHLVLLPMLEFYVEGFLEPATNADGETEMAWTDEARQFAGPLVSAMLALDSALKDGDVATPTPDWASDVKFATSEERDLLAQLLQAEATLEQAQRMKEKVTEDLKAASILRSLLFEKGKPLEQAIIYALEKLGFTATSYKDEHSEFDVVFVSDEGRLLGETEGKDAKAVNVDKLRQLSMNIHEDLLREDVSAPAKAVLFGNGFRLTEPSERPMQFTEKCIAAAKSSSTALVPTSVLFEAALHATEQNDDTFAAECRDALLSQVGIVAFPTFSKDTPRTGVAEAV